MPSLRRPMLVQGAAGVGFAGASATLFVLGDERDGPLAFFVGWLTVHVLYGVAAGSFWALLIVLACPPLLVAVAGTNGDDTPLWIQNASVELFYGIPFAFMGVVARRLWQARRPPELPTESSGEPFHG